MSIPLDIGKKVVDKLRPKFDDVAVVINQKDYVMVKLWNSEPSVTQSWMDTQVSLLLTKDKKVLMLGLSVRDPEAILGAVENLGPAIQNMEESELYAPLPEPSRLSPLTGTVDKAVIEAMRDPSPLVEEMLEGAAEYKVDRVAGTLVLGKSTRTLVTSKGFEGVEEGTELEAYLRAFKGEFSGHWAFGSRRVEKEMIRDVGAKAGYYATLSSSKAEFTPGKYDVVLSPLVIGNLIDYIGFMASAAAVLMGFSMFMKFKPGDKVGSEKFTLEDIPRDVELPGSVSFDDEGVPTSNKPIIHEGKLVNLLHNSGTAKKMGAESTGNAGWLMPSPWNLKIPTGDLNEEDLARELGNGIIINNNWYTRLQNYVEGIFSTVSRDATLLVKNGEIVGNLGRIRIADRFTTLLNNIENYTKKHYKIKWWEVETPVKAPYVLIRNLNITKPFI